MSSPVSGVCGIGGCERETATETPMATAMKTISARANRTKSRRSSGARSSPGTSRRRCTTPASPSRTSSTALTVMSQPYVVVTRSSGPVRRSDAFTMPENATAAKAQPASVE